MTEVNLLTSYDSLAEVYEWLISDAKLTPAEFAASFDDVLSLVPSNAQVLYPDRASRLARVARPFR